MKRRNSQCGGTLVEGALTILVFLMFIIGILEFGRIYNVYQTLTDASREAARFAVAPCPTGSTSASCPYGSGQLPTVADIRTHALEFIDSANITLDDATTRIKVCRQNDTSGCPARPASETACSGFANPACSSVNNVCTCYTRVTVEAPYQFIFFPFGTVTLHSNARMRDENN